MMHLLDQLMNYISLWFTCMFVRKYLMHLLMINFSYCERLTEQISLYKKE